MVVAEVAEVAEVHIYSLCIGIGGWVGGRVREGGKKRGRERRYDRRVEGCRRRHTAGYGGLKREKGRRTGVE